jgi:hypothetical protein
VSNTWSTKPHPQRDLRIPTFVVVTAAIAVGIAIYPDGLARLASICVGFAMQTEAVAYLWPFVSGAAVGVTVAEVVAQRRRRHWNGGAKSVSLYARQLSAADRLAVVLASLETNVEIRVEFSRGEQGSYRATLIDPSGDKILEADAESAQQAERVAVARYLLRAASR